MSFFSKITHKLKDIGHTVGGTVSGAVREAGQIVTHPSEIPGAILDGALEPLTVATATVGGATELLGRVSKDQGLIKAGRSIVRVDAEVNKETLQNPIASAEVVAGSALVVGGVLTGGAVSAAGLGLIVKGGATIAAAVIRDEQTKPVSVPKAPAGAPGGVGIPAPAPALGAVSMTAGTPALPLWERLVDWVDVRLLHKPSRYS